MADTQSVFVKAANHARTLSNVSETDMLKLYGLYKQAKEGACNIAKPYFWDFTAKAKWENWKRYSTLTREEAASNYVALVRSLDTKWDSESSDVTDVKRGEGFGLSVSIPCKEIERTISEADKTIFDFCEEGDLIRVEAFLKNGDSALLNTTDENNLTLLHWAVDRGHLELAHLLLRVGCDVNAIDSDGLTPLHYAVTCEHLDVIELLLAHGADTSLKDNDGNTPQDGTNKEIIKSLLSRVPKL